MESKLVNSTFVRAMFGVEIIALLFFTLDVIFDMRDHFILKQAYSISELVHLIFEFLAVVGLAGGLLITAKYLQRLKRDTDIIKLSLYSLREDFDGMVKLKFESWGLTLAERDVAILLLRGLGTSEISEIRSTSIGTVKLQAHKILQKAGVQSRVEFMSMFIDEFMDVGLQSDGR